ncbi:MAG TPA: right-handed parallel beta-helix repeat-containing protein, partial [Pyrinomonadaceae bacterium]|nr:right-handed parallel beta-helix repeat-containing protein [Pyrinomonadaceae bacterium]
VEGNVLENNWADGQVGYAIVLTPGNGTGSASAVVQEVTITNNIIRHTGAGVNILDYGWVVGNTRASRQTNRITIKNNLFQDVNANVWGGEGTFVKLTGTPQVTFDHNTVLQTGNITTAYGNANEQFQFTNNIVNHNQYGLMGAGQGGGNPTIAVFFPNGLIRRNVFIGAEAERYPGDNFFPPSLEGVKFADRARGDFRLAAASAYRARGTDGKDVGCDIAALNAALAETDRLPL